MTEIVLNGNLIPTRDFRTFTASTKVTELELAELERAAAARGIRLGEWIREVLLREAKASSHTVAIGRILTEIVGLQLFLTNVLAPIACGERMSADQYQDLMRQVKAKKHQATREVLAQYGTEEKEQPDD